MIKSQDSKNRLGYQSLINISRRGSILIIALWALALLSVFAIIMGAQARYKITLVNRLDERAKLRSIAEAGVKMAAAEIKGHTENIYHSMSDTWSDNPGIFKDVNVGEGDFTVSYDYSYDRSKKPELKYGLIDEERKVNINRVDMTTLKKLFMQVLPTGETNAQELAASIIDWRDGDSELSVPIGSAESMHYHGLIYPYEAKNSDFEIMDELLLVKGVDKEFLSKINDYATVYGTGRVNINTASKEVLMAIGLSERIADSIITFRLGKDEIAGTADDGIFDLPSNIVPQISQFFSLSPSDLLIVSTVAEQYLAVTSSAFSMRSVARSRNKKNSFTTMAVIDKKGKVLYWQES